MNIKKLQSNRTTTEQSKKLLELGVPAWTADIMFDVNCRRYELIETEDESLAETQRTLFYNGGAIPCWSVGRLIEILKIVAERGFLGVHFDNLMTAENNVESLIHAIDATFPRYKKRQEKTDVAKAKQQVINKDKVFHSIETLDFANKIYGELLPTDDELVSMHDFLY